MQNEIQSVPQVESSLSSRGNGTSRDILFTFLRFFSQNQFQTLDAYVVLKLSQFEAKETSCLKVGIHFFDKYFTGG